MTDEETKAEIVKGEHFDFSVAQITEAADTWVIFPSFSGEVCGNCNKEANVLLGSGWICVCGHFNAMALSGGHVLHESPDLGPTLEVIKEGIQASTKWQKYFNSENENG